MIFWVAFRLRNITLYILLFYFLFAFLNNKLATKASSLYFIVNNMINLHKKLKKDFLLFVVINNFSSRAPFPFRDKGLFWFRNINSLWLCNVIITVTNRILYFSTWICFLSCYLNVNNNFTLSNNWLLRKSLWNLWWKNKVFGKNAKVTLHVEFE